MPLLQSRKFRWAVLISGVLLILVIGGLAAAVYNIEGLIRSRKDPILAELSIALGREVTAGDLNVSVWSGLGVQVNDLVIGDDPGFSKEPFLTAKHLNLKLAWRPLLNKDVQISDFQFEEPQIQLIRDAKGVMNTASLSKAGTSGSGGESGSGVKVSVQSFRIDDGQVTYTDKAAGQTTDIKQIDMKVDRFSPDRAFPVQLSAALFADKPNLHFDGNVGPLSNPQVDGQLRIDSTPLEPLKQTAALKKAIPAALQLEGSISGQTPLKGSLQQLVMQPNMDARDTQIAYSNQFVKPKGEPLTIRGDITYTPKGIDVTTLTVDMKPALVLTGKGTIGLGEKSGAVLNLQSDAVDLAGLQKTIPPIQPYEPKGSARFDISIDTTKKVPAQGQVEFLDAALKIAALPKPIENIKGQVQFGASSATAPDLNLKIGQSDFNIKADVKKFTPMQADYTLRSNTLAIADVAKVDPQKVIDTLRQVETTGTYSVEDGKAKANGKMKSDAGTLYGIEYQNLNGTYNLANQVFSAKNLNLQALNGTMEANATYDMSRQPPSFEVSTQAKKIDLVEIFRQKSVTVPQFISGHADLALDLSGAGQNWEAIKPTLQGKGNAVVLDGMIMNVNLSDSLLGGLSKLPMFTGFISDLQQQYPTLFQSEHTMFEKLEIKAGINGSRINLEPMMLAATEWLIQGDGIYDMDQGVNGNALLQLSKGLSGFLLNRVAELKYLTDREGKIVVPFSVQGALNNLKASPNQEVVGNLVTNAVAGKAIEVLSGKKGGTITDILQGGLSKQLPAGLPNIPGLPIPRSSKEAADLTQEAAREASRPASKEAPETVPTQKTSAPAAVPQSATPEAAATESRSAPRRSQAAMEEVQEATTGPRISSPRASKSRAATSEPRTATPETRAATPETKAAASKTRAATGETQPATRETRAARAKTQSATAETRAATAETHTATAETRNATGTSKPRARTKPEDQVKKAVDGLLQGVLGGEK